MNAKNVCEKYELAITNYVLGEKMPTPKAELLEHLKTCPKCRKDLDDWQNTYALMRAQASDSKPETKVKWEKFVKELVNQPGVASLDTETELPGQVFIGRPAGAVWYCIGKANKLHLDDLAEKSNLPPQVAYGSMGWLICQEKIRVTGTKDAFYLHLTPNEQQIYNSHYGG